MSGFILGKNQYSKAESHVIRIYRDTPRHDIHDINVSICLRGDFTAAHVTGDPSDVLRTDTQKQTAYATPRRRGWYRSKTTVWSPSRSTNAWQRAVVDGAEHDHTWICKGQEVRTAAVTVDGDGEWVVGGLKDLVILKSTGSQFAGFLTDAYTILEPTHDRVMATSLVAQRRFTRPAEDWQIAWDEVYTGVKTQLVNSSRWCGRLRFSRRRAGELPGNRRGAAVGAEQTPLRL